MAKLSRIGQYKLVRKLGQGGMGAVFEGIQESLDRRVAIKILPAQFMRDPAFVERFKREAKAAARLNHPSIVTIHEIGEDQGFHFFSMELVDGQSLQQRLESQGPLAVSEAVSLMLQAIRGLSHAWDQQIVHRDIKPDNLMLTKAGILKITDLGLARVREEMGTMTQTGAGMGTPYYMSPEQGCNAKDADLRSDVYSLGATFYHLLTGRVPFEGSSPIEVAIKVATAAFPPVREVRPDTPPAVATVIEKMLARKPDDRFQNAAELLKAIESLSQPAQPAAMENPPLEKITIRCHSCGTTREVSAEHAGKRARCKKCNAVVTVPTKERKQERIDTDNDAPAGDTYSLDKVGGATEMKGNGDSVEMGLFQTGCLFGEVVVMWIVHEQVPQANLISVIRTVVRNLDTTMQYLDLSFPFMPGIGREKCVQLASESVQSQLVSRGSRQLVLYALGLQLGMADRWIANLDGNKNNSSAFTILSQQGQIGLDGALANARSLNLASEMTGELERLQKIPGFGSSSSELRRYSASVGALRAKIKDHLNASGSRLTEHQIVDRASTFIAATFGN